MMRAVDVFTPGKLPDVTFIDDHLKERSRVLLDALEAGGSVISLSGPSKSGKTVFIEKVVGKERLVQITGAGVTSAKQLWDRVFDIVGTPIPQAESTGSGFEAKLAAKAGGEVALVVGVSGEVSAAGTWTKSHATQSTVATDYLQLLIRELSDTGFVVFIDDFHYIPRDVQVEISNQIKEAIRNGVIFVVASVPYHSDDAIRANTDLRGRSVKLDFNYWDTAELTKIARRGFEALKISASEAYISALSSEAAGSPQLMQALCLASCHENGIREVQQALKQIACDHDAIKKVCGRIAFTSDYSSTVAKLREGPKTRGQGRNSYLLKDESVCDVYPLILLAIASDPPELTLRYANLQARIARLCKQDQPSGSSVTGSCSHLAAIANTSEGKNIIEWDAGHDVLDIRDPYLLFYLRWGE